MTTSFSQDSKQEVRIVGVGKFLFLLRFTLEIKKPVPKIKTSVCSRQENSGGLATFYLPSALRAVEMGRVSSVLLGGHVQTIAAILSRKSVQVCSALCSDIYSMACLHRGDQKVSSV